MSDTLQILTEIFRDVFDDDGLTLKPETTALDVPGWNSLTHIDLIYAIERRLKVKFSTAEVTALGNVGDLEALIARKRGSVA